MPRASTKSAGSRAGDVHASRLRRLRAAFDAQGIDALLVTYPGDIRYLTGFSGEDSYALVTRRQLHILSDFRFEQELEPFARRAEVVIRTEPMTAATVSLIAQLRPGVVGVQSEHLSASIRAAIAAGVGARRVKDTTGMLSELRVIKDDTEVRLIRKAARIQQEALETILPLIKPGLTEAAISARLEYEMKVRGASGPSFETIVAARDNGSKPHYRPGAVKVASGKALLIDWGARYQGYCSDMTRTFAIGRWPRELREVYEIVLEAHLTAIDAAGPGVTCEHVDGVARSIIARAGYGDRFGHGLGHGIGLDIHEQPRLARNMTQKLKPGMVVTIEPGIYLPGIGGVRIEDDIFITPTGRTNLCSLPKDIRWATLNG